MRIFTPASLWDNRAMLLVRPHPALAPDCIAPLAAKHAWIDRYRRRLMQSLPEIAAMEAALLAVEAYALPHACSLCPDDSAARFAAARAAVIPAST
jgi:hypothetical protein